MLARSESAAQPKPAEAAVAPVPAAPAEAEAQAEAQPEGEAKPQVEPESPVEAAETPAEAVPEGEAEGDDLSQDDGRFTPEQKAEISKIVSKRVSKLKGKEAEKLSALEAKVSQAETELAAAKARADAYVQAVEAAKPLPTYTDNPNDPLAKVATMQDLQAEYTKANSALLDAEELLDRGVPEEGITIGNQTFTESDLKAIRRNAKRLISEQIPQRSQFLQASGQWKQKAATEFAYLQDKNNPDYVRHMAAYQTLPVLRSLPNSDYIIGAVMAYEKSKEKAAAAAKPAPVKPKAPASQAASSAAPSARTREPSDVVRTRASDAEAKAIMEKGNLTTKDLTKFFTLKR